MKKAVGIGVAVVAGGAVALGGAWIVGTTLPAEHEVRLSVATRQGPAAVWKIVSDLEAQPAWRSDLTKVERVEDIAGKAAWRETSADGDARILVTAGWSPPHSLQRDHVEDGYLRGTVSVDLVPEGMGTRVTVTEKQFTPSPLGRVTQRVFGRTGTSAAFYLRSLADHLGDTGNKVVVADEPPPE
jgi:hypothetical protein